MIFTLFANMATQASGGDPDANAYISAITSAGGTLSSGEETAIQDFYTGLKSDGIYSKMYAMYPFLGGVADSNKINAVNPGTYDLTFSGTAWEHSVSGSFGSRAASPKYADTGFNPSASASPTDNLSFSVMNADRVFSGGGYSGLGSGGTNYIILDFTSNNAGGFYPNQKTVNTGGSTADGAWAFVSRTGASSWFAGGIRSGSAASGGFTKTSTQTSTYSTPYDATFYINGINDAGFGDGGRYTFSHIAEGLTTSEIDDLLVRVNDLQTEFGHNIFS